MEATRANAEAIRQRCHDSFAEFVKEAWHVIEPGRRLVWSWHLQAMCDHLQAITEGRLSPWLIINVPPGSSKSTIVSVLWQAWEWGPRGLRSHRFLSTSFEEENVKRDTRKTRDLIRSEWYRMLWPDVVMSRAGETSFANTDTGTREGVPFYSITGKRGDRVLIDDPHSLKGAESDTERSKATQQFLEGGLNRLNDQSTSAIVIVMQRLHEADLTGVLLSHNLGFIHLRIPMEFEADTRCETPLPWTDPRAYEGELMDPIRMPRDAVEKLKGVSEYSWAGQYQQRPSPREGGLFKVDKIELVEAAPAGGITVRAWDLAGSKRKKSPYTVGLKMRWVGKALYIMDVKRERLTPFGMEKLVTDTAEDDGFDTMQALPQDPGQAGKAQKYNFADMLSGYEFRITPETGDKADRAVPFASQVEAGTVFMVRGPWNDPFTNELRHFPSGAYKDQVDACSRAYGEILRKRRGDDDDPIPAGARVIEPTELAEV
jgi:predicted phage terminase large subunit-like protein